ncbi:hypothetical protein APS67_004571 [Streptomyces sp. AVP053U2]|nr:hypothetical protein APS67_004571 [Streptomyces sp. AVP053U2]
MAAQVQPPFGPCRRTVRLGGPDLRHGPRPAATRTRRSVHRDGIHHRRLQCRRCRPSGPHHPRRPPGPGRGHVAPHRHRSQCAGCAARGSDPVLLERLTAESLADTFRVPDGPYVRGGRPLCGTGLDSIVLPGGTTVWGVAGVVHGCLSGIGATRDESAHPGKPTGAGDGPPAAHCGPHTRPLTHAAGPVLTGVPGPAVSADGAASRPGPYCCSVPSAGRGWIRWYGRLCHFDRQRDDVLVVDNTLTAHGRAPFTGHLKNAVARGSPSAPVADRQSGRTDTPQTTMPDPHHSGGGGPRARPTASDSRDTSPEQGRRRGRLPGRPRRRPSAPRPRGCRATRRRRRTERGINRSAPGQKVTPVCPPAPPPCGAGRGRPERPPRSRRAPRRCPWPPRASPTGSRWTSTPRAGPARSTCPTG